MSSFVIPVDPATLEVVLKPMQIRTFQVTLKWHLSVMFLRQTRCSVPETCNLLRFVLLKIISLYQLCTVWNVRVATRYESQHYFGFGFFIHWVGSGGCSKRSQHHEYRDFGRLQCFSAIAVILHHNCDYWWILWKISIKNTDDVLFCLSCWQLDRPCTWPFNYIILPNCCQHDYGNGGNSVIAKV